MKQLICALIAVCSLSAALPVSAADTVVPEGYRLQPGDVLQVVVWKETDLQSEVLIRPDGGISFALAGDLQAAGLTTDELRTELQLRVRKLVPDAVVTVQLKVASGNRVFVIGKVKPSRRFRADPAHRCDAGAESGRRRHPIRGHRSDSRATPRGFSSDVDAVPLQ